MSDSVIAHGNGWVASVDDFDIDNVQQNWLKMRDGMTDRVREITAGMLIETAIQAGQADRIPNDSVLLKDSGYRRI